MLLIGSSIAILFAQSFAPCDAVQSTALAGKARNELSSRQFEAAVQNYARALEVCPGNTDLLVEKANALFLARRLAEAQAAVDQVLAHGPNQAAALKLKGNAQYLLGEYDGSIRTFSVLLERFPNDDEAAYMLGRIYYQEGRIDQAMGQFQRALKLNPMSYKAWDNLGLCWQASGDTEKAISHFLHAIKLVETAHPEYDWAYANLADILLQTGDPEHAFAAAAKAAKRNPNAARNFYLGAKALDKLGRTELCLNWLQRAASLQPDYSDAQYLLARVYQRLGQDDQAEAARKRFAELKAKEPGKRR